MQIGQGVQHLQHGEGVLEDITDPAFLAVRFGDKVVRLNGENLSTIDGRALIAPKPTVIEKVKKSRTKGTSYKGPNELRAYVARLLMEQYPSLNGFITPKELQMGEDQQQTCFEAAQKFFAANPDFVSLVLRFKDSGINEVGISLPWELWRWSVEKSEFVISALQERIAVVKEKAAQQAA